MTMPLFFVKLFFLQWVRTCRIASLSCYMESLDDLMPWVMALDRTNYARNIPVFLRDLCVLKERDTDLYIQLSMNGNFMGQKSKHAFSKIPIDQCTEQVVCWLKQESAVIGNLDNPETVRRDQVAWPELARIIKEFEQKPQESETRHHEQYPKFQKDFKV